MWKVGGWGVGGCNCDELRRNQFTKQPARKPIKTNELACLLPFAVLVKII